MNNNNNSRTITLMRNKKTGNKLSFSNAKNSYSVYKKICEIAGIENISYNTYNRKLNQGIYNFLYIEVQKIEIIGNQQMNQIDTYANHLSENSGDNIIQSSLPS